MLNIILLLFGYVLQSQKYLFMNNFDFNTLLNLIAMMLSNISLKTSNVGKKIKGIIFILNLKIFFLYIEGLFCLDDLELHSTLYFRILSAMAHWSPIFGETQYLPCLAFPFVKLFQNNHLVCFEILCSIMSKYSF